MNKELWLESITVSDAEKIRDIMVKIVGDEITRWFKDGGKPYVPGYNSIDMQKYHTWDNKYYKIMHYDDIAGVILICHTGREHARIDRFYILPEYQNKGIGSKVLRLIEELFQKVNIWTLDTFQYSPRNHHFYESNGYVLVGEDSDERYYYKEKHNEENKLEGCWDSKDLNNNNFRNCNMNNVDIYNSDMSNSRFSNMNLSGSIYSNSNLRNSRFTNTNISNSIFGDSNMSKVEICHVNLSEAYIHDINLDIDKEKRTITMERCELTNSKIIDSNLKDLKIENCNIEGMTINGISVIDMVEVYRKHK